MEKENEVREPDLGYGGLYSYADYLLWTIGERYELIKGKVFHMSPAPGRLHQGLSMNLSGLLWSFLRDQPCKVYSAPFDVRLPRASRSDREIYNVVQPDVCVICDASKLDDRGCIGAPDIVIEILSPGNNAKELKLKYDLYEEFGVREYWILSPQDKTFLKYTLHEGRFTPSRLMVPGDVVTSAVLPGFKLDLEELFGKS